MLTGTATSILLVEDNPLDVALVERAFQQLAFGYRLSVVNNGVEAVKYVNGEGPYADRKQYPFPSLILLDLTLPIMDGFKFLRWLRRSALCHVPVIVLSGSSFSPDVTRAYAAGANSFLSKPSGLAELAAAMRSLMEYWLGNCRLPAATGVARPGNQEGGVRGVEKVEALKR